MIVLKNTSHLCTTKENHNKIFYKIFTDESEESILTVWLTNPSVMLTLGNGEVDSDFDLDEDFLIRT